MTDDTAQLAALSALLDEMWDPIGVYASDLAGSYPPGEYRSYAPGILALLNRGASSAEVAWHLRDLSHKEMDLAPSGRENDLADLLLRWHSLWTA